MGFEPTWPAIRSVLRFSFKCNFIIDKKFFGRKGYTLVTPMAPIFPPYVVVAWPHPNIPAIVLQNPSIAMPLFTA
jgi:hypothetical protein